MDASETTTVSLNLEGGVARIRFARSGRRNAFNEVMSAELRWVVEGLREDPRVAALVLEGDGEHFMAGADVGMLHDWASLAPEALENRLRRGFSPTMLEQLPYPVVAAVDGFALGMGFEIALAADLRVATTRAVFGLPEVTLGLMPGAGGTQRLPRLIGATRATEMAMTGRRVDADTAEAWGLVNQVVDVSQLNEVVSEIVGTFRELPPQSLAQIKACLGATRNHSLTDGLELELKRFVATVVGPEAAEGTTAFLEKRSPQFRQTSDWDVRGTST